MRRRGVALVVLLSAVTVAAAKVDQIREVFSASETPTLQVPDGWPAPRYTFADNPVTAAGFALGRQLFYDPSLSRDGTVACASCHQQFAAFAHADHRVSHGVGGANGVRNAPGLFNLAWQPDFMWDGAGTHLETQPILPLGNPLEMATTLEDVIHKLQADPRYPPLFRRAFGNAPIDSQHLLRALAQFTGTLVSADSHYDRMRAGREVFTAEEQAGLVSFRAHCAGCHAEPLFTDYQYRANGLDARPKDRGRAAITGRAADEGHMRVPSLRNVALTAPYMHDGRYDTLEQVLDHYEHGITPGPTLDPALAGGILLRDDERRALLVFLHTLTDTGFVQDPRFATPAGEPANAPRTPAIAALRQTKLRGGVRSSTVLAGPGGEPEVELVTVREGGDLVFYLDDYASNTPRADLQLDLRIGSRQLRAERTAAGQYRLPLDLVDEAGDRSARLRVVGEAFESVTVLTLPAATDS